MYSIFMTQIIEVKKKPNHSKPICHCGNIDSDVQPLSINIGAMVENQARSKTREQEQWTMPFLLVPESLEF